MLYGSETWATKVADMHRLSRAEMMMVRWMCGVSLKERKPNQELLGRLGIVCVTEVVRRSRLRWFGHLERKCGAGWVTNCRDLVVDGDRCRGRGRKTWSDCVEEDMIRLGLKRKDVHKREEWRKGIRGVRLTRASAEKQTLNKDDDDDDDECSARRQVQMIFVIPDFVIFCPKVGVDDFCHS
jgi:hypothetical protein